MFNLYTCICKVVYPIYRFPSVSFRVFLFVFVSIIELTYNYRKHFFLPRCATAITVLAEVSLITALSKYNIKRNGIHFD